MKPFHVDVMWKLAPLGLLALIALGCSGRKCCNPCDRTQAQPYTTYKVKPDHPFTHFKLVNDDDSDPAQEIKAATFYACRDTGCTNYTRWLPTPVPIRPAGGAADVDTDPVQILAIKLDMLYDSDAAAHSSGSWTSGGSYLRQAEVHFQGLDRAKKYRVTVRLQRYKDPEFEPVDDKKNLEWIDADPPVDPF